MTKLNKLATVSESINVYRYDNGWMVEIGGKDTKDDWKTAKIMCATEEEMIQLIKEYNSMELNN